MFEFPDAGPVDAPIETLSCPLQYVLAASTPMKTLLKPQVIK